MCYSTWRDSGLRHRHEPQRKSLHITNAPASGQLTSQQGTFWIHGHYEGQYVDGLRTPSVIHPLAGNATGRSDNVTWTEEYTLIVSDWYNDQHSDLLDEFLNWKNPTGAEPVPDSALIYLLRNDTYYPSAQAINDGSGTNNNTVIPFEAGNYYKVRVVSMAAFSMFFINFDQHDVWVIEVDGVEIEPYKLTEDDQMNFITISVAQRYSLLVKAQDSNDKQYALSVIQSQDMYDTVPPELIVNNTITIGYGGNTQLADPVWFDEYPTLDDTKFVPLEAKHSAPATTKFRLDVYFDTYNDGNNRASFNNVTYVAPTVPSIFTALTMGDDALIDNKYGFHENVYGAMTNPFTYKHMEEVEIEVFNWDAGFHPFHLHGHEFQVMRKVFDTTSNDTELNPELVDDQSNPSRRDTITIPPTGSVTLRWRADNPGAWFFHCHIDWHLSSGLAATFIEAPEVFQKNVSLVPQSMYDHCAHWNTPTSGNVVGLNSTTDFKGQPFGPFPLTMNWTSKAIGAMAGCILSFLCGLAAIIWYGWGELDEGEVEEEVRRGIAAKQARRSKLKKLIGKK